MGMDVYGKNPSNEKGKYFRNNAWYWRPLWNYCVELSPLLLRDVDGHSNSGDGLDSQKAVELARILQIEIISGRTWDYANKRQAILDALPLLRCKYCEGTGDRKDLGPPEWKAEMNGCNVCHGSGKVKDWETQYPFNVKNVRDFVVFLEHCGGFEIC